MVFMAARESVVSDDVRSTNVNLEEYQSQQFSSRVNRGLTLYGYVRT
jgi:hypothetical protein